MQGKTGRFPRPSFRARIFIALVGISAVTSLVIGLVLYYFAQDRLVDTESDLLARRARTANVGAGDFLEGLRNPEDQTLPAPETYAGELVRSMADVTGLGVLYVGPNGDPLAARDGFGDTVKPRQAYRWLGLDDGIVERATRSPAGQGRLVPRKGPRYFAVFPLVDVDGHTRGVMVYTTPQEGLDQTLAYLRYGILGAILASVLLAGLGSLLLTRQITAPSRRPAMPPSGSRPATTRPRCPSRATTSWARWPDPSTTWPRRSNTTSGRYRNRKAAWRLSWKPPPKQSSPPIPAGT